MLVQHPASFVFINNYYRIWGAIGKRIICGTMKFYTARIPKNDLLETFEIEKTQRLKLEHSFIAHAQKVNNDDNGKWIENIIARSHSVTPVCSKELDLVKASIKTASNNADSNFGLNIAALYDLVISAVYYTNITNDGWLYCYADNNPQLILPFVNCCPVHALRNTFVFHSSSKPTSAKIGQATTRVLLLFYQELFNANRVSMEVLKAIEPADAIFLDRSNKKVMFAEIKSSPLLTPALSSSCDVMTTRGRNGETIRVTHKKTPNPNIINNKLYLLIPIKNGNVWEMKPYLLGKKQSADDETFAYDGLLNLLRNQEFVNDYLAYWKESFRLYSIKNDSESIFWLTNACGKPNGLENWGGGTTCISDEKTSVGMDRTDDIKKGIYQVLKLGSEGKVNCGDWEYKVGILSNIHPARHFDAYLAPIKDMIWAICKEKNIKVASDLDANTRVFNLFDGIVTFTKCYMRDTWLEKKLSILTAKTNDLFETQE